MARLSYFQKAARASEPTRAALPTSHALLQRWELLTRAQDSLNEAPTVSQIAPVASTVEQSLSPQRTPDVTAIPPAQRNTVSETQPESAAIVRTTSSTPAPQRAPASEADDLSLTTQELVEPASTTAQRSAAQSSENVASPTSTAASSINKDVHAGSTAEEIHLPESNAARSLKKDGPSQVETTPHVAPDAREATGPEKASPIPQQKENRRQSSTEEREEKKGAQAIQTLQPARRHKVESEPVSQERLSLGASPLRESEARAYETASPPPKQQQRQRQQVLLTPQPHEPLEKSARPVEPAAAAQPSVHIGEINVQVLPQPPQPPVVPAPTEARPLSSPQRAATLSRGLTSVFGLRQG